MKRVQRGTRQRAAANGVEPARRRGARIAPEIRAQIKARLDKRRALTIAQARALFFEVRALEREISALRSHPPPELVDRWIQNEIDRLEKAIERAERGEARARPGRRPAARPKPGARKPHDRRVITS